MPSRTVQFETRQTSMPTDGLSRVDVAGFAGFAKSGPFDLPVRVVGLREFRDVFGGAPTLGWDRVGRAAIVGTLEASVSQFFANGGDACWVVRVGRRTDGKVRATTGTARIPGLIGAFLSVRPIEVPLRSPGAWGDRLRVKARLSRRSLRTRNASGDRVELGTNPYSLLEFRRDGLRGFAFADTAGGVRPSEIRWFEAANIESDAWIFEELAPDGSRRTLAGGSFSPLRRTFACDDPQITVGSLIVASRTDRTGREAQFVVRSQEEGLHDCSPSLRDTAPPASLGDTRASELSLALAVFDGGALASEVRGLAFHAFHPRHFGRLPDDVEYFAPRPVGIPARNSRLEAYAGGRFALAGDPTAPPAWPLHVADSYEEQSGAPLRPGDDEELRFDSLEQVQNALLDERYCELSGTALVRAMREDIAIGVDGAGHSEAPRGIHALLATPEVSILSLSDASVPLSITESSARLASATPPILKYSKKSAGNLSWSPGLRPDASGREAFAQSRLESDETPDFSSPTLLYLGPGQEIPYEAPARGLVYLRVRGEDHHSATPWSGTVVVDSQEPFHSCGRIVDPPNGFSADGANGVKWELVDGATGYQLQGSEHEDFASPALDVFLGAERRYRAERLPPLMRVRALSDAMHGPWSAPLMIPAGDPSRRLVEIFRPDGASATGASTQLAQFFNKVTVACAARGDVLALLTLPRHFSSKFTTNLVLDLESQMARKSDLSFAALQHPWLVVAAPSGALSAVPADGAVAGLTARRARRGTAWVGIAGLEVASVVDVDSNAHGPDASVNVARRLPTSVSFETEHTLEPTGAVGRISTRMLLSLIRRLLLQVGSVELFDTNGPAFFRRVTARVSGALARLWRRGALKGATSNQAFSVVATEVHAGHQQGRAEFEVLVNPGASLQRLRVRLRDDSELYPIVEEPAA